jgi:hypothetical protein
MFSITEYDEKNMFSESRVYPNPFNSFIELGFNSSSDAGVRLSIADMTGRIIYSDEYNVQEGDNNIRINTLENIPSGIYFLRMEHGTSRLTSKLVKH